MSAADINNALTMPYVAYVILGKGGVIAVLIMVFQAITSALSSGTKAFPILYQLQTNPMNSRSCSCLKSDQLRFLPLVHQSLSDRKTTPARLSPRRGGLRAPSSFYCSRSLLCWLFRIVHRDCNRDSD